MRKIAVFGAALNPPTNAHREITEKLSKEFDVVLVVPSFKHPFGKKMQPFEHRLRMCQLMIDSINSNNICLSTIESTIAKEKDVVYTYDVLTYLKSQYPHDEFCFVMGEDNYRNFKNFYKADYILENFKTQVIKDIPEVRSTYLRKAIEEKKTNVNSLTIPSILRYITHFNLYKSS